MLSTAVDYEIAQYPDSNKIGMRDRTCADLRPDQSGRTNTTARLGSRTAVRVVATVRMRTAGGSRRPQRPGEAEEEREAVVLIAQLAHQELGLPRGTST